MDDEQAEDLAIANRLVSFISTGGGKKSLEAKSSFGRRPSTP